MTSMPWKGIRVAIAPPAHDETFSSVMDRAAAFWRMDRAGLMSSWMLRETSAIHAAEVDAPTPALISALAHTIGVKEEAMRQTIVDPDDMLVAEAHRIAYCPLCWLEDSEEGRGPYFRRSWCSLAVIRCERHAVPLCPWPRDLYSGRCGPPMRQSIRFEDDIWRHSLNYATAWRDATDNQPLRNALREIAAFSAQAIEALQGGEFPIHWRGDVNALRDLIVLLTTNPAPFAERIPLDRLVPEVVDEQMFGSRRGTAAPLSAREGWKAVRQLGSPVVRRTLWWLVGRTIVPQWKPMPIRGFPGICYDAQTWWKRRIEASVSGHALLEAQRVSSQLGLRIPEQIRDLFAA